MFGENAVLTAINGPGTPDSYGDVAAAGTVLWTGRASCYLRRVRKRSRSGETVTLTDGDEMYLRRVVGVPIVELAGDQAQATRVSVTDNRTTPAVARTFRVVSVDNRAGGTSVDAIRLELADVR